MPRRTTYQQGTIAEDDPKAFEDKYHFRPDGETDTALKKIWGAREREEKRRVPGGNDQMKAAWEQFKTANADYKAILLAHRALKINEWNADHGWVNGEPPAEESSSDEDEDEDGVDASLPQFAERGRRQDDLAYVLEEQPELVGEESLWGRAARAHAKRLLESREQADEEIKKKAWEHSDKRWAAYRAKAARTGGARTLRGARSAVNAASRTKIVAGDDRAVWTDKAAAVLTTMVDAEETTPTWAAADQQTWERIASAVNAKVDGAKYTWEQCRNKAYHLKLLEAELPDPHLYHPELPARKVNLDGLPKDVLRGRDARDEFMALPMVTLCWLMGFVYNAYVPYYTETTRKQEVVDALVAAEMCACDPNDHGVALPYLKTPAFTRAFNTKQLQRMNADISNAALERAMGPPSKRRGLHGGPISGSDKAGYARLMMSRLLKMFSLEFAPRLGEHPPRRFYPEVIEYFTTCKYSEHVDFDAKQDCAVCGGLFIDLGGRVFCGYQRYNHCTFESESISRRRLDCTHRSISPQASTATPRRPASSPFERTGRASGATRAGSASSTRSGSSATRCRINSLRAVAPDDACALSTKAAATVAAEWSRLTIGFHTGMALPSQRSGAPPPISPSGGLRRRSVIARRHSVGN